jgi:GntR family transcriptional regulator
LKIVLSNRSGTPIYEQIKTQVKEAIFSGELKEDDVLPSIRQLAKDLKISVITTTRVYSDLEQEGFVVNVQGKGCYVLPQNHELAKENTRYKVEELLRQALDTAKSGNLTKDEFMEIVSILCQEEPYE